MNRLMRGAAATCMVAMMTLIGNSAAQNTTALTDERAKLSYAIGLDVANGFQQVAEFVDVAALQKAVQNTFDEGQPLITQEEAQSTDAALRATLAARSGQPTGLPPGVQPPAPDKTKVGLLLGSFAVGPGLVPLKEDIDLSILFQAVRTSFGKGASLLPEEEARAVLSAYASRKQSEMAEKQRVEGAKQIALGQEFLEKNKSVKGVITTPSGLQYQVLRAGSGERPVAANTVRVNYEGRLLDGKVFDSSYERGQPAEFPLGGVIAGWTEGIPLMNVGAKYRFWIPSELAYGERGAGNDIPANATLTFDVELLGVLQ